MRRGHLGGSDPELGALDTPGPLSRSATWQDLTSVLGFPLHQGSRWVPRLPRLRSAGLPALAEFSLVSPSAESGSAGPPRPLSAADVYGRAPHRLARISGLIWGSGDSVCWGRSRMTAAWRGRGQGEAGRGPGSVLSTVWGAG